MTGTLDSGGHWEPSEPRHFGTVEVGVEPHAGIPAAPKRMAGEAGRQDGLGTGFSGDNKGAAIGTHWREPHRAGASRNDRQGCRRDGNGRRGEEAKKLATIHQPALPVKSERPQSYP